MAFTDNTTGGRVILEGLLPITVTLTDTCEVGDLIGYDGVGSDAWERADADGKVPASLIAAERCETSGDTIKCYKIAVIDGFTSATTGDSVYLSNTAGAYASTPGSWVAQMVGEMVSATKAFVSPTHQALFSYATTGTGWGAYVRSELESGRTSMNIWGGMRIDFKSIATSVVTADAYGLYIFGQLQQAPVGSSALLRLEDGCASSCGVDGYITFVTGTADPPDFALVFGAVNEPTNSAWSIGTAASGSITGNIKIKIGSSTRYLAVYSAA